jgi:hypothetical protein
LHRELLELRRICLNTEREREREKEKNIHMSLGRQKKTFLFSPKLGHSYSAIALRWLLAKKNKSAPPKRKRGEIFALNFM